MHDHSAARPVLLIFIQWYTPAHKAGGPIRSIENLVQLISDRFNIYIFSGDRDLGDPTPFDGVVFNQWHSLATNCKVMYADRSHQSASHIRATVKSLEPQAVYLNSMYGWRFALLPLWVLSAMKFKGRIVLAPRGMLKASAIAFKSWKKNIFLSVLRTTSFLNGIRFHATDQQEADDIRRLLQISPHHISLVHNAAYMPAAPILHEKTIGQLNLVFVGRIHPIKGLDVALEALRKVTAEVILKVVGWIEDKNYLDKCEAIISSLPDNVRVEICGDMNFREVLLQLNKAHVLILPTHGENFGHSILEALSVGKPVIISDQTPWKNLTDQKIGFDIADKNIDKYMQAIEAFASMDSDSYQEWSNQAVAFAKKYITDSNLKELYTSLFYART